MQWAGSGVGPAGGGGGLAGSQSRPHPSVMIDSTRADTSPICCMVASQYGRWARSRYSGEAGAASPVCCSTCSKRRRTSSSAASMSTSMRSKAPVAAVAQGRDVRVGRRGAPAPFTNSSPSSVKLPQTTGAASPRVGSVLIKSLARQGARAHQKTHTRRLRDGWEPILYPFAGADRRHPDICPAPILQSPTRRSLHAITRPLSSDAAGRRSVGRFRQLRSEHSGPGLHRPRSGSRASGLS